MKLEITWDFVSQILAASPKDSPVVEQLAAQLVASIDHSAMATYLFTRETAVSLLAERLQNDAAGTIKALEDLSTRVEETAKPAAPEARSRKLRSKDKRPRVSAKKAADLREKVCAFLKSNGWSSRRELSAAVGLKTDAIFRHVVGELQEDGQVGCKGENELAVYGLRKK